MLQRGASIPTGGQRCYQRWSLCCKSDMAAANDCWCLGGASCGRRHCCERKVKVLPAMDVVATSGRRGFYQPWPLVLQAVVGGAARHGWRCCQHQTTVLPATSYSAANRGHRCYERWCGAARHGRRSCRRPAMLQAAAMSTANDATSGHDASSGRRGCYLAGALNNGQWYKQ
jgi:hypothetical protein